MSKAGKKSTKLDQAADLLLEGIQSGELRGQLEPVAVLAERYGVSLVTMHRALTVLKDSGDLRIVPGRGTFVNERKYSRTHRIGLVVGQFGTAPLTAQLVQGVYRAGENAHQTILLKEHYGDPDREEDVLKLLVNDNQVDGMILWSSDMPRAAEFLLQHQVPHVFVPDPVPEYEGHLVCGDDAGAAAELIDLFISTGVENILCLVGKGQKKGGAFAARMDAYKTGLNAAGLQPKPPVVVPDGGPFPDSLQVKLKAAGALFCIDDRLAARALAFCVRHGIRVPGDILISGYDNTSVAELLDLTSVEQNFEAIGTRAVERLLGWVAEGNDTPNCEVIRSEIIHRGSTTI